MLAPAEPKIYHIVHIDRLPSIIADGYLWCDAEVARRSSPGSTIGMSGIKRRRLEELCLTSHPDLRVGDCAPFYFCPRSIMLYLIHMRNPELAYRGGQDPIIHLEADLRETVAWADANKRRWAFTASNAGARGFNDYSDLRDLNKLDWNAINARIWSNRKHGKQAEFLVEKSVPWSLIRRVGAQSRRIRLRALRDIQASAHKPPVEIRRDWYY